MKPLAYIGLLMKEPNGGQLVHLAELRLIDETTAELLRLLELDGEEIIKGAGTPEKMYGTPNIPERYVPHPDVYGNFPDVSLRIISQEVFGALWAEAEAIFPELAAE
ncbi:hypothetical protein [Corynebacterium caspium]|uniref:hypothetical protein n=1 Tax=Corynebacterium caspium TaxID=234828 RepID=UPI00036A31F1|nr:hypothetical protein [Corynebacterium caspium]